MRKYFALVIVGGIFLSTYVLVSFTKTAQEQEEKNKTETIQEQEDKNKTETSQEQEAQLETVNPNKTKEVQKTIVKDQSSSQKPRREISNENGCKEISDIQNQRQCYLHFMEKNVQEQKTSSKKRKARLEKQFKRTIREYCETFPQGEKVQICLIIESKGFSTSTSQ